MSFFKKMVDKIEDLVGDDDKKKDEKKEDKHKEDKHDGILSPPHYCPTQPDIFHNRYQRPRLPRPTPVQPTTSLQSAASIRPTPRLRWTPSFARTNHHRRPYTSTRLDRPMGPKQPTMVLPRTSHRPHPMGSSTTLARRLPSTRSTSWLLRPCSTHGWS